VSNPEELDERSREMSEQERFEREANRDVEAHVNRRTDEPKDEMDRVRETDEPNDEVEGHVLTPRAKTRNR
jgi:hypothetical protein